MRGNVEMNNFTRRFVIILGVQEVVRERKDLMPEGSARLSFMLILTYRPWMHYRGRRDHSRQLLSGDTRRLPSRTMEMFSPSHTAIRRLRKAGISWSMVWKPISWRIVSLSSGKKWRWTCRKRPTWFWRGNDRMLFIYNETWFQVAASKMSWTISLPGDRFIVRHPLSAFTTELTGITDIHVKCQTTGTSFAKFKILQGLEDCPNATFDVGFYECQLGAMVCLD